MRCRWVQRLSTEYLAGGLDERQRSALRGHLRQCEACRQAYDDEAALARAADSLEPLDPPPSLWEGISERLAQAELADAGRSRAWFWWRGAWSRLRWHALGASLAAATALLLWLRTGVDEPGHPAVARGGDAVAVAPAGPSRAPAPVPAAREFDEAVAQEVARADARYEGAIAELESMVAEQRASWSALQEERFQRASARFQARVAQMRQHGLQPGRVLERDDLYAVYRDRIDYLSDLAFAEDSW